MKEVSVSFLKEGSYKEYIEKINKTNADYIHFDVMDGKFTENKNLLPSELIKLIKQSKKKNDVHLMVKNPDKYIEILSLYDIEYLTIHYEIKDYVKYIDKIKNYGIKPGISINPSTDVQNIFPILEKVGLVLIMGVVPGKSGQVFIEGTESKIKLLKEEIKRQNLNIKIEVDGGINEKVIDKISDADIIVSASYVLNDFNNINKLKEL